MTEIETGRWITNATDSDSVLGMNSVEPRESSSRWKVHAERVVDESRKFKVSIASVELPDGDTFEQYVFRMPKAAMVVALNHANEVLMLWRHRFVVDRWTYELPGGYVDPGEEPAAAAARELIEETGWQAGSVTLLGSFQAMDGTADFENWLYLAEDLVDLGTTPDVNEAARIEWVPLDLALQRIAKGEVIGAGAQLGLLYTIQHLRTVYGAS